MWIRTPYRVNLSITAGTKTRSYDRFFSLKKTFCPSVWASRLIFDSRRFRFLLELLTCPFHSCPVLCIAHVVTQQTTHGKKITTKPQKTGVFKGSPRCLMDGPRSALNDRSVPRFSTPQKMKVAVTCVNTAMHRMASNLGFQYRREMQSKPRSYMM